MKNYSFLKAYPVEIDTRGDDNHLYIHALADGKDYSLAFNVESNNNSKIMYYLIREYTAEDLLSFLHVSADLTDDIYKQCIDMPTRSLDYFNTDLFDVSEMEHCKDRSTGENVLLDKLTELAEAAFKDPSAYVLAFGSLWGPKKHETDWTFGFCPGMGLHDIHCNHDEEDACSRKNRSGYHDDGALFFVFPDENKAYGIFAMFRI